MTNGQKELYLDLSTSKTEPPGKGVLNPKFALVGLAPSPYRPADRKNEPFGAKTWKMMRRIIHNLGPENVYMTNLVKEAQPVRKKVRKKVLTQYYPGLIEELKLVNPERVICFGAQVAAMLCPGYENLLEDHGTLFWNPSLEKVVVPTYHPSSVSDDPDRVKMLMHDLSRAERLPDPKPPKFRVINGYEELRRTLNKIPQFPMIFIDIESTGTHYDDDITVVGFTWDLHDTAYLVKPPYSTDHELSFKLLKLLQRTFEGKFSTLVGHNLTFDLSLLSHSSGSIWNFPVRDTMLMAFVLGEEKLSLKHLTSVHTDRPGSRSMGGFQDDAYAAEDVFSTREVYWELEPRSSKVFARTLYEHLTVPVVEMTLAGVHIEREELLEILPHYREAESNSKDKLEGLLKQIPGYGTAQVNWNSYQQVGAVLVAAGVPLKEKTASGNLSVKHEVLEENRKYQIVEALLEYRDANSLLKFLEDWEVRTREKNRLNPKMKIFGARTGRTSMADPNLQNVPRLGPAKTVFCSRYKNGLMGLMDLNQAELRVAGLLSGDAEFCQMLMEEDPHRAIASRVYKKSQVDVSSIQRKKSKSVTFGLLYDGSVRGMAKRGGFDEKEVASVRQEMFEEFTGVKSWLKGQRRIAVIDREVYTAFGKRRDLSGLLYSAGDRDAGRKAINTPIQGTASEILLWLVAMTWGSLKKSPLHTRPLFGIHDSMMLDIYPGEVDRLVQSISLAFISLQDTPLKDFKMFWKIPFTGELVVGKTWAAIESTNENYNPMMIYHFSSLEGLTGKEEKDGEEFRKYQEVSREPQEAHQVV